MKDATNAQRAMWMVLITSLAAPFFVSLICLGLALGRPATGVPPHAVYNLGNCRPQKLTDFVSVLEQNIGLKASLELAPMQAGDVTHTFADIEASRRDLGFEPVTPIETGLKHFVGWYRGYHAH